MTAPKPKRIRTIMAPWRVQGNRGVFDTFTCAAQFGAFDEIVVGSWLHVEAMNDRCAWVRLGERVFDVFVERGDIVVRERPEVLP